MIINQNMLKQTPLTEGGEGIIYEINNQILKIFKPSVNIPEKYNKIQLLLQKQLPKNVIVPSELAFDNNQKFIGYLMPKIQGEEIKKLSNRKYVQIHNITNKELTKLAIQIKDVLINLHNNNIFISDLSDSNVVFNSNFEPYFIDVDSWTIDGIYCTVCMETFQDPNMISNHFSKETDSFAFAILLFKMLTRLHPFGGTMIPDVNILRRMVKGISVIDHPEVTVPPTVNRWDFMSPLLLKDMKNIFEKGQRFLIDDSLMDFSTNLKFCPTHKDYYYGKFSTCPICNIDAIINQQPIKIQGINGTIPYIILVSYPDVKIILNENSYIDIDNYIVHTLTKTKVKYVKGNRYYFSTSGENLFTVSNKDIQINNQKGTFKFEKIFNSPIVYKNDELYYINLNCNLTQLKVHEIGNSLQTITKVGFNSIFEIEDINTFFVCNIYDGFKILNISGYNYNLNNNDKIINYGIHYDIIQKRWLFIIENTRGAFLTYIFEKNKLIFSSDTIKYTADLTTICFNNGIIFTANEGVIKGFNYIDNTYKDFSCKGIKEGAKLIKEGNKFIAVNDKEVIKIG